MARGLALDRNGKLLLSEACVQRQCVDFMRAEGFRPIRTGYGEIHRKGQVVDRYGEEGMPDYLFIKYGSLPAARLVWVEFKRKEKRSRTIQTAWQQLERGRGAEVWTDVKSFEQMKAKFAETFGPLGQKVR